MYWNDTLNFADATPVAVTSGGTTTGIDAAMIAPSTVSGIVRDAAGNPVAGADVLLETVDPNIFTYLTATTAADGSYTVDDVVPSSYTVVVTPTGTSLEPTRREDPVTVGREAAVTGVDVVVAAADSADHGQRPRQGRRRERQPDRRSAPRARLGDRRAEAGRRPRHVHCDDGCRRYVQPHRHRRGLLRRQRHRTALDANGFPIFVRYSLNTALSDLGASNNGSIYVAGGQAAQIDGG